MLLALGIFTYKNDQNIISLFENVNLLNLFQGIDARNLSSSGIRFALVADGWEAFKKVGELVSGWWHFGISS